jgi:hypothetical protein
MLPQTSQACSSTDFATPKKQNNTDFIVAKSPTSSNLRDYSNQIGETHTANDLHESTIILDTPNKRELEQACAFALNGNQFTLFATPEKSASNSSPENKLITSQKKSKQIYSSKPTKHITCTITKNDIQSGDRGKSQNQVMSMSAITHALTSAATTKLKGEIDEWLHAQGFAIGGSQARENLFGGSYNCNRFMLLVENFIRNNLNGGTIVYVGLDITVYLHKLNDGSNLYTHIADKLEYTITIDNNNYATFEFFPQRSYRPPKIIRQSLREFFKSRLIDGDKTEISSDNVEELINKK